MTYNNQNSEKYWNNKILEWENSYLNNNETRVSFVEKIASKFRGPLKKRLEVSERIISENSSKENIYVEFGSGSGELLFSLYKKNNTKKYIGLDLSKEAVSLGNQKIKQNNFKNISFEYFNCNENTINDINFGDFYFGLGFIDYLDLNEVKKLLLHLENNQKKYLFSFPEKKINIINTLQFFYLKYQGCPKFNKFERSSFSKINNCHFLDIGSLAFVTNIQI